MTAQTPIDDHSNPFTADWHGRTFHDLNRIYMLPSDQIELERLSLQHTTLLSLLDRLYPCSQQTLHRILAPNPNRPPKILDVGSGSGIWCIQLSIELPHAQVVGIDIARSNPRHIPANCEFLTWDINHGLSRFYDQFDFVHCRCMAGSVRVFADLIRELGRCLRPGGILVHGEGDLKVYNDSKQLAPIRLDNDTDPTHSYLARILFEVAQLNARRAAGSVGWTLTNLLAADGQYLDIDSTRVWAPIGWDGDGSLSNGAQVGRLMKMNCYEFVRAWRPLLLLNGFDTALVDYWIREIDDELHEPTVLRQYTVWHYAWGFKRATSPPPPPPPLPVPGLVEGSSREQERQRMPREQEQRVSAPREQEYRVPQEMRTPREHEPRPLQEQDFRAQDYPVLPPPREPDNRSGPIILPSLSSFTRLPPLPASPGFEHASPLPSSPLNSRSRSPHDLDDRPRPARRQRIM